MKILFILTMLFMVGCNEAAIEEAIGSEVTGEFVNKIDIPYTVNEGTYSTELCEPDNRKGFVSYKVNVYPAQVVVAARYHLQSDCSDTGYDRTHTEYNINGENLEYVKTEYADLLGDNYTACGLKDLTLGVHYDIDGIGCGLSLESVSVKIIDNQDNTISLIGKTFR